MSRSARMFEIIQMLRTQTQPVTAQHIAACLEVTKRTVYRDIASLQAMRVPIDGAAGVGYIMRPGFDLPPVNFDPEEAEAITVGLRMIARTGDKGLERAARRAGAKLANATKMSDRVFTSAWGAAPPRHIDLAETRRAIRQDQKMTLAYCDASQRSTTRVVLPLAMIYYAEAVVLAAWCELRDDFRHFRLDRIQSAVIRADRFSETGAGLRRQWADLHAADL